MKKKLVVAVFFLTLSASLFAQAREDTLIFVAPPIAEPAMASFLHEHFSMEVMGANYTLTESRSQSDFVIALEVMENMVLFEDGSMDRAPEGMPQYLLQLALLDNNLDFEMLSFSWPFTETEEIFEFSLTMVYQAMANVPVTRLGDLEIDDRWRNMWLYLRFSFEFPVVLANALQPPGTIWHPENVNIYSSPGHSIRQVPGATIGVELHFWDWVSAELAFMLRFGDVDGFAFTPGIGLKVKFPLKPGQHLKISPYIIYNRAMDTGGTALTFPANEIGGGVQLGVRGGPTGAFFLDINFLFAVGDMLMPNNHPTLTEPGTLTFQRRSISIGIGYKIGFMERLPPHRRR